MPNRGGTEFRFFDILQKEKGQQMLSFLVRKTGLEPVRCTPHAPQTCASASSATSAFDRMFSCQRVRLYHMGLGLSIAFLKKLLNFREKECILYLTK